ncbi:MAG: DNA-3-methyladenine glycosylase I [Alphaproteobacteria bacterium]
MNDYETSDDITRCGWVGQGKPHYEAYHDQEWGVPVTDDRTHFEYLILEGAQAGLNWETVLKKREGYRACFHDFDPVKVAAMSDEELEALRQDARIIRNKLKIYAARKNAIAFLQIQQEFGSFNDYIWGFVGGETIYNDHEDMSTVQAETEESRALAKDLKKRGMSFCGPTIMYAHMQAAGLVHDHLTGCHRHYSRAGKPE